MNQLRKITSVIWDWNGTLLDDVKICVDSINIMLEKRNLKLLSTEQYRALFRFPVLDYYRAIGFDFSAESFENMSDEFMNLYFERLKYTNLTRSSLDTLHGLASLGIRQRIISAMKQEDLENSVFHFGIRPYFDGLHGAGNHFAEGKMKHAKEIIQNSGQKLKSILMIGDTIHDAEIALELNCACFLYSGGHHGRKRLETYGFRVIDDVKEVLNFFKSVKP